MRARSALAVLALAACNAPPGAPEVAILPSSPVTSDDLEAVIATEAVDPDGDEVVYTWAWSLDGALVADLSDAVVPADRTAKGQTWSVVVIPSDGKSDGAEATASVTVGNTPPTAAVSLPSTPPSTDEDVTASVVTDDADGDSVTVTWSWTVDGVAADVDGPTVSASLTARGEVWAVTATPNDGTEQGEPSTASISIANVAPVIDDVSLTPASPREADTITATVAATDADGDVLAYTYAWKVGGTSIAPTADTIDGAWFDKGDAVTVTVTASDGLATSAPVTSSAVTVDNTPPSVASASVSPTTLAKGVSAECRPGAWTDADGDAAGYRVTWLVNGVAVSTDATLTDSRFARGDRVACELEPFDGEEAGTKVRSAEVLVANTPPSITGVTLSTTSPRERDAITVSVTGAADADGDKVTWTWEWTVDGTVVSSAATLTGTSFDKGQVIECTVTPTDGIDTGTPLTSKSATAVNTPPVLTGVSLAPDPVYTNDLLVVTATAADDDGDKVGFSYAWTVDGRTASSTTDRLDGTVAFSRDQAIVATVTPHDGEDAGASDTARIRVSNSVPTAPEVAIDPVAPAPGDDVWCEVVTEATDADGDALAYEMSWTVDGVPAKAFTTTWPGDTATTTAVEEEWECTAVATDGTDTSAEATDLVTVQGYGLTRDSAVKDCNTLHGLDAKLGSGTYWIDPDGDTDHSDAFQAVCDMTTAGGGWTLAWYVDAAHFDGWVANDLVTAKTAPTKLNASGDVWNAEAVMSFSETLLGCTTEGDAATHYWRYATKNPHTYFANTTTDYEYRTDASAASSTTTGNCIAAHKGGSGKPFGFLVVESSSSCGSCTTMLWGMYHYNAGSGCNSTDRTYGSHTSPYRSATLEYPICGGKQTSNGKFWIGVR